jgi:flagellar protein FlaG
MAINSIQQTNILQIQQMQQVQPVQKEREGGVDTAGNAADQLAQEVETVKQTTNVAPYSQEDGYDDSQNQENASQLQHALEVADEQNEKNNEKISKAIANINQKMTANTEAVFGFHDKTNRVTIKIVDKDTKKVVKEFPPEKTLDMIAKAWELAGIMVDERK